LTKGALLISDRGTFSLEHVARLRRHDCYALCSAPWGDYQRLYDEHADTLKWQQASFLSREQQRRRATATALPLEHYELAVLRHTLTDPQTNRPIPCRVLFVYSTADATICRETRRKDIEKLRAGLGQIAATVARGHARTTQESVTRRVVELFGRR